MNLVLASPSRGLPSIEEHSTRQKRVMAGRNFSYLEFNLFPNLNLMDLTTHLTALACVVLATALATFSFLRPRSTGKENVYDLRGIPIITAWTFFTKRYDFFREKFKESGGRAFRFKVLQVSAVL